MEDQLNDESLMIYDLAIAKGLPLGKSISIELSQVLGDVLQSWNFLRHFHQALGLENCFSFDGLTTELNGLLSHGLFEAHISMLGVLISETPIFAYTTKKKIKVDVPVPVVNELTWPELARRYCLSVLSSTGGLASKEGRDDMDVFRCLCGDGGTLCGALTGVVGLKADAWFLGAAVDTIFGSLNDDNDELALDAIKSDQNCACQNTWVNDELPDWVLELEPVKKLKTNVGSKIKKCIQNSLDKNPDVWAREALERSISKDVYKANASGPTKQVALNVVSNFHKKMKKFISISDIVMKQCRIVLRQIAAEEEAKAFCLLLGTEMMEGDGNNDPMLRYLTVLSRPLDFRTIDMRLAIDAYCGSHEAFREDVKELWRNLSIAESMKPNLVQLADKFESLYDKEVVALHQKLVKYSKFESLGTSLKIDIENILASVSVIPKAPWEEVCRVCDIDKDDEKVLLCDICNAGYHTYCLSPPLDSVPQGKWYCPRDVSNNEITGETSHRTTASVGLPKKKRERVNLIPNGKWYYPRHVSNNDITGETSSRTTASVGLPKKKREFVNLIMNEAADLATMMGDREYWELNMRERTLLLRFFCDEMLNASPIREQLDERKTTKAELSLKSEFLGFDSAGRLYWILDSGASPWIIVNESNEWHKYDHASKNAELRGLTKSLTSAGDNCSNSSVYSSWYCYQSEEEIKRILDFIEDDQVLKKQWNKTILKQYRKGVRLTEDSKSHEQMDSQPSFVKAGQDYNPPTRATALLQSKYGQFHKIEETDFIIQRKKGSMVVEGKMYRCGCLEPILPTGSHCFLCHRTSYSKTDLKFHDNGGCNAVWPMLVEGKEVSGGATANFVAGHELTREKEKITHCEDGCVSPLSVIGRAIQGNESQRRDPENIKQEGRKSLLENMAVELDISQFLKLPGSSVRPLMGKAYDVLMHLKLCLLDVEAALPKDAVTSSKACINRKWAWRAFVKRASTIYEMVQALIVFEDMINPRYLDCKWWHWSSPSAAANISTLAALSLRIYTLDSALNYEKIVCASNPPQKRTRQSNLGSTGKALGKRSEKS